MMNVAVAMQIDGIPRSIQIIPYGTYQTDKGTFTLDRDAAIGVMADFTGRVNEMVIDYEHQTLSGSEAPAAGWIRRLVDKGVEGIWAEVDWTGRAREYLRNREYRYVSPVFVMRVSDGKVMRLLNAALTNLPAIDGMIPLVNKDLSVANALVNKDHSSEEEVTKGEELPLRSNKEVYMKNVLEQLGLPETATEEQALEAIAAMKASAIAEAVASALGISPGAALDEVLCAIGSMRQGSERAETLACSLAALEARVLQIEAGELVGLAMKAGKVTPAQGAWAEEYATKDPEGFKAFIAKAPAVLPLGSDPVRHAHPVTAVDGVQAVVNSVMGISAESFRKFGN